MSSDDLTDFWLHQVIVRTYRGTSGAGHKLYTDPAAVTGFLSRRRRYIRNAQGDQVISSSSFSADIGQVAALALESLVIFDPSGEPFGAGTFGAGADFGGALNNPSTVILNVDESRADPLIEGIDRVRVYLQ